MAAAQTPLHEKQESEMSNARRLRPVCGADAQPDKRTMSPLLIAILVVMAIFPLVAWFLPAPILQNFDVLFH